MLDSVTTNVMVETKWVSDEGEYGKDLSHYSRGLFYISTSANFGAN